MSLRFKIIAPTIIATFVINAVLIFFMNVNGWVLIALEELVILVVLFVVSTNMVERLKRLASTIQKMTEGDLDVRNSEDDTKIGDEIGVMAGSFNILAKKLNSIIDSIHVVVEGLTEKVKEENEQLSFQLKIVEETKAKDEAILENIGDGVIAIDKEGKIVILNKAAEKMLSIKSTDAKGRFHGEVWKLVDAKGFAVTKENQPIEIVLKTKKNFVSTLVSPYYSVTSNDTKFPVGITAQPVMLGDELLGSVAIFRDISKEWAVDRAKTEFVSLASHQLRTPLSTINWYSELMLNGDGGQITDEQREFVTMIFNTNKRMTELVNDLLDVSRMELGTISFDPKPVDLREITTNALGELKERIQTKKLTINQNIEELPLLLLDPKLTHVIFQNLLSNAVKYTPVEGTVTLSISISNPELAGINKGRNKYVLIKVADTGIGIPLDSQEKIFSKLFRAKNAQKLDVEGTGLGLYLAKSIVERSGGKIWFDSIQDKGTTFYAALPLKKPKSAALKKKSV